MRPYQIFAAMPPERARELFAALAEQAPGAWAQTLALAAGALRARPVFLRRLPFERRAEAARRALARVASDPVAEEMLAAYFLECRKPLLVEWLDRLGLAHEEGALRDEKPAQPAAEALAREVAAFRAAAADGDAGDRELLLRAFAAQSAIDWPELERILAAA
jgi:hypothetical protein